MPSVRQISSLSRSSKRATPAVASPLLAGSQGPFERGPVPRRPRQSPPRSLVCPESDHRCHRPAGRRANVDDTLEQDVVADRIHCSNPPGDWMPPGCLTARNTRRNVSWMASSMSADERTRERSLITSNSRKYPVKWVSVSGSPVPTDQGNGDRTHAFIAQAARSYVLALEKAQCKNSRSSCTRRRRHGRVVAFDKPKRLIRHMTTVRARKLRTVCSRAAAC